MNIYEQLNRISANESLSEKYVVRSTKELRKLHEDYDEDEVDYAEFIPEEMTQFFCIDYEDDENPDEYMPSKGYKNYKAVASLRAYGTYADALCDNGHGYALLINDPTDDFFVGYVVGDRLHKLTYEDILDELGIDNEYDDLLTGEDLRVAISEELPFVIDELGSRDNIDDIADSMTDHLDESGFDYDAEEVRKIVVELTALNEDVQTSAAVKSGIQKIIETATTQLSPVAAQLEGSLVEYFDKYKQELEGAGINDVKNSIDELVRYIQIEFVDKLNNFNSQLKSGDSDIRRKLRGIGLNV